MIKKLFLSLFFILFSYSCFAIKLSDFTSSTPQVLPPEEAFRLLITLKSDNSTLDIHWQIAPDYYLYRDKTKITADVPFSFTMPHAEKIVDDYFGEQYIYYHDLSISIPLQNTPEKFPLTLTYQGCALSGFCYPPITSTWEIDRINGRVTSLTNTFSETVREEIQTLNNLEMEPNAVMALFSQQSMLWLLLIFYGLGLLLTFTPCVLPMIPILSSIIVGQHNTPRTWHSFGLSFSYVIGMVMTYTIAGVFAGLAGSTLQSYLQTPLFIGVSAVVLFLLAGSLFGFYHLQLPASLQNKLHQLTHAIRGGRYLSAWVLGILSALVVSPCVTAPLIGALTYISTTGDALLGGSALFALSVGMGTPLLIIGTLGPRILPQTGDWLLIVQYIFGVLLIAVALWMITRLLSPAWSLVLWGVATVVAASYLGPLQTNVKLGWKRLQQALAWILLLCGILLIMAGGRTVLQPWLPIPLTSSESTTHFVPVKTWEEVQQHVERSNKPVLLDIYADWCVTCIVIEQNVFPDPQVAELLKKFTLLRADVTAQDAEDRALQHHYTIFAPPALLFFSPGGEEYTNARLAGDIDAEAFAEHLQIILASQ